MPNDLVRLAMEDATVRFGVRGDGLFNAANFGLALMKRANLNGSIDGMLVRAILCGRDDVDVLRGGSHYRLRERPAPTPQTGEK